MTSQPVLRPGRVVTWRDIDAVEHTGRVQAVHGHEVSVVETIEDPTCASGASTIEHRLPEMSLTPCP